MATWIAHLRIAENILRNGRGLDKTAFVSGNIAPDAGVPNEDWSIFSHLLILLIGKMRQEKSMPIISSIGI